MTSATSVTEDTDADGTIDKITITFDRNVDITDANGGNGFPSLSLSGNCVIPNAAYGALNTPNLVITGLTGCDAGTDLTPTVTYTSDATHTIVDNAAPADELADGSIVLTDNAGPAIISAVSIDDATDDTFSITIYNKVFLQVILVV
jgi:hypothetical protein